MMFIVMSMATAIVERAKLDLNGVPADVQKTIATFICSIGDTSFFRSGGNTDKPNEKWMVFRDHTLQAAHQKAWEIAREEAHNNRRGFEFNPECDGAVNSRDMTWNEEYHKAFAAGWRAALDSGYEEQWRATWCWAWGAVYETIYSNGIMGGLNEQQAHITAEGVAADVALFACLKLVRDLEYPDKEVHGAHAAERMEIRQKGYYIAAYVNRVPYVYAKDNQIATREMLREPAF